MHIFKQLFLGTVEAVNSTLVWILKLLFGAVIAFVIGTISAGGACLYFDIPLLPYALLGGGLASVIYIAFICLFIEQPGFAFWGD